MSRHQQQEEERYLITLLGIVLAYFLFSRPRTWQHSWTFQFNHIKIKGNIMAATLRDDEQITGTLALYDAKQKPAKALAGSVKFSSSDENIAKVVQDPQDENTITVVAQGPGVAALKGSFKDQDGNDHSLDDLAIEVLPGDAQTGGISFGAPTKQVVQTAQAQQATTSSSVSEAAKADTATSADNTGTTTTEQASVSQAGS